MAASFGTNVRRRAYGPGTTHAGPHYTRYTTRSGVREIISEMYRSNPDGLCDEFEDFNGPRITPATSEVLGSYDGSPGSGDPTVTSILRADVANGVFRVKLDAENQQQAYALSNADQRTIPDNKPFFFRARVSIPDNNITTNQRVAIGLASDLTAAGTLDAVARNFWFRLEASMALLAESDDGTTDNDDKSTGITIVKDTWYTLSIDGRDPGKVRYWVNNGMVKELAATAVDGTTMQWAVVVEKGTGTTQPACDVDFMRAVWERV